jgi:hypothetical protein
MINLFQFKTKSVNKKKFIEDFFKDPNHQWINNNSELKKSINILLNDLTDNHIQFFSKHKTYIIPCEANLSCAIGKTKDNHLILVFPELFQMLQSASRTHGLAILAHELGHIYHQHTENKVNTLQAQIEADEFAFNLGYGEELQEVLLEHNYSIDCRVRIARLTAGLITEKAKIH